MAKITRAQGASKADGTQPPVLEELGGIDLQLLGPNADLLVSGRVQVARSVNVRGVDLTGKTALARYRNQVARAASGDKEACIAFVGDSFTEGFTATKRGKRWVDILGRLLNGPTGRSVRYYPATGGTFSATTDAPSWPGGQVPWSYSGTVTGDVTYGADLHAANLATSATMTLTYFGDVVNLIYVRKPNGPSAAAVTLDGAAQTAINAQGTELVGQGAVFGTFGDYGFHTLVVTATAAPLTIEGALVLDGPTSVAFGIPLGAVSVFGLGHAGFTTGLFASNNNWATSLARITCNSALGLDVSLVGIALGANDNTFGVSAATYTANLLTMIGQIDAAVVAAGIAASARPGYLLILFPTAAASYAEAAWQVATTVGLDRCEVLDLRAKLPDGGSTWGDFDSGAHPNDAGQIWIAQQIAEHLSGAVALGPLPTMPAGGPTLLAGTEPLKRSAWTVSLGTTLGQTYDATSNDTTVRERRERVWLEPGTYVPRIRYEERTSNGGTLEVLVGGVSAGTKATNGTDGVLSEQDLTSNAITIDYAGSYPVVVRKTSAAGLVRFVQVRLRKTA